MSIASLFSNTKRTTAKGYVYCCVQYCKSCTKKNPELSFHNFPRAGKSMVEIKDFFGNVCVMDRREAWINQLKITKQTSPNLKVCSKHFTDDDFSTPNSLIYACRFLNKNAVPSKYLPLSEREQEKLENIKIKKDETASVSSPCDEEMPFEVAPEFALMDQDVYKQSSTVINEMDIKLEPLDATTIKTEPVGDTESLNKTLEEDALIPTAEFNDFESFKLKTVKLEFKTEPFDEDTTVDVGELLTNEDIQNLVAENALSSNEVYVKQEFNHFETEQITVTKPEIANEVYVKEEFIAVKSEPTEITAIKPEIVNKALPNRCNTCGAKFPSKELRDLHYIESTCKSRYVCEVCNMSCRSKWTLNNHQLKHTEERQFSCEKCESTFKYKAHWKLHMRKHTDEKNHVCTVCGAAFFQPSKLKYHMDVHTDSNPFSCETCGKKFKLRVSLYQHTLLHQGKKKKRDKSEYLKCEECGKMLSSTWTLSNHMLTHSGEKKFSCEQCGKSFTTVNALTLHSWIHKGKTFKCPHCPKKFAQKMNLTHHKKAHLGIKPHECDLCDKTFLASSQLKAHKLSHSGEKPHQCTICENKFVSAANLRIHLRIHTGEKPFSCEFCNKSFYDAGAKRKHVKKWHLDAFLESEKNKSNN